MQWVQKGSASLIYFNSDLPGVLGAYSCTDAKTITMTSKIKVDVEITSI